jgi:hypothetical protein
LLVNLSLGVIVTCLFTPQKYIQKWIIFDKSFRRQTRERTKQISLLGSQTQFFSCVENTTKNNVYSCWNLDAKRYHFKSTKRGQKSHRFQLMFQRGLKIGQRERHVWMLCFWSKNPSATAVVCSVHRAAGDPRAPPPDRDDDAPPDPIYLSSIIISIKHHPRLQVTTIFAATHHCSAPSTKNKKQE